MHSSLPAGHQPWPSSFFFAALARAGGPEYVAGSSYFNSSTMGQPLTWSLGQVNYYTDQGDLSPILPNAAANALVASAFGQWTSVSTAAITATNAGQLAEDVNGGNIAVNSNGIVSAPADITSSATQTPVGIVYDYDGSVTDALLGVRRGRSFAMFLERGLWRRGQLRHRRNIPARAGGHQRPVRAAIVATHGRGIPAGASAGHGDRPGLVADESERHHRQSAHQRRTTTPAFP